MIALLAAAFLNQPTAEAVESARAEAMGLIAAADAADAFEDATVDHVPAVRHLSSGLICRFTPFEPDNTLTIHPEAPGMPHGQSVACTTHVSGMIATTYATRYAQPLSAWEAVARAAQAIRDHYAGAVEHTGGFPLLTRPDSDAAPLYTAFSVPDADPPLVTFVLIRHQGDWSFKFRGTQGGDDMTGAAIIGGMMFMNALPQGPLTDAP